MPAQQDVILGKAMAAFFFHYAKKTGGHEIQIPERYRQVLAYAAIDFLINPIRRQIDPEVFAKDGLDWDRNLVAPNTGSKRHLTKEALPSPTDRETGVKKTEDWSNLLDQSSKNLLPAYEKLQERGGSTFDEFWGIVQELDSEHLSQPAEEQDSTLQALRELNLAISDNLAPLAARLKVILKENKNKSWPTYETNRRVADLIQDTASRLGLLFVCSKCERPARFRCNLAGRAKHGIFVFEHADGTHSAGTSIPQLHLTQMPKKSRKQA